MFDQMRADWFSAAGAHWCPTPNLDRLSAMGTRFTECVTNSPVCMAVQIGLATGQRSHRLGVVDNSGRLMEATPNWYQHFRDHGYRVALRGKEHFDPVELACDDFGRDGNVQETTQL
jgi:arylsulfatase